MLARQLVQRFRHSCVIMRGLSSETPEPDVIFEDHGNKGLIILNKPKQLNALNHSMVLKIYPKLKEWDAKKDLIVIKGCIEKAFCAGGDVVAITRDTTGKTGKDYFRSEYLNNGRVASLKTPYVALINGIVMGGGVGLSVHGKYRVATETTLFAMPETQIGLFPDVGVSHFLSRMPNQLGMFLALTGYRLKGFDVCHVGIATHFCHTSLLSSLQSEVLQKGADVDQVLQKYHSESISKLPNGQPAFTLQNHIETIDKCFSAGTVEEILQRLQKNGDDFSTNVLKLTCGMSPKSLKITAEQLRRAASLNVYEVLNMDYRIGFKLMEQHDFFEGIRALLVDKDKSPKWKPDKLELVTDAEVQEVFKPLDKSEELNLPESLNA